MIYISTPAQLQAINNNLSGNYQLLNDIDLTGVSWTPIGTIGNGGFVGSLNGGGFAIRNLTLSYTGTDGYVGLFEQIGNNSGGTATITDLNLIGFTLGVGAADQGGALAAFIYNATITSVNVSSLIINFLQDNSTAGSLAGEIFGHDATPCAITDCTINGVTVNCGAHIGSVFGGFTGFASGQINLSSLSITSCSVSSLTVNGSTSAVDASGFINSCSSAVTIEQCYSQGVLSLIVGGAGFIGYLTTGPALIQNCYAHVNITIEATNSDFAIGGFIGGVGIAHVSSIINCYSDGSITGNAIDYDVGGFIGYIPCSYSAALNIINCYSVGIVSGTSIRTGGFIGYIQNQGGVAPVVTNCSWWTSAFAYAIGQDYLGNTGQSLTQEGYGTDQAANTAFYSKTNIVYEQGGGNAWDFIHTWVAQPSDYPLFVGATPVSGVGTCKYLAIGQARKVVSTLGGLDYLDGQIVSIVADGQIANPPTATIANGIVNLIPPAATVHVGLPYAWTLQFLPLGGDGQTVNQGKKRKIYDIVLRIFKSLGGQVGADSNLLFPINYKAIENVNRNTDDNVLFTGDLHAVGFESKMSDYCMPVLTDDAPLPFMLLGAIIRSEIDEDK